MPLPSISRLIEHRLEVATAVEDAVEDHRVGIEVESEGDPSFKPDHPQSLQQVVATSSTFRKGRETAAIVLDPFEVGQGASLAGLFGYV